MPDEGACAAIAALMSEGSNDPVPDRPTIGHVCPAHGGITHRVEPGSTWAVQLRPDEVRQVAKRVRRQLAAGEHPSLDEVKILVDALLDE